MAFIVILDVPPPASTSYDNDSMELYMERGIRSEFNNNWREKPIPFLDDRSDDSDVQILRIS